GLLQVAGAGPGRVGQRGGLGHADAEHAPGGACRPGADPDQHAGGAGAHEVQRGRVGGAAADDHRQVITGDEGLEVERLGGHRDVLRRDHGALDDQDVEAGLQGVGVVTGDPLGGERRGGHHPGALDLLDPAADQLRVDGLGVDLLHALGGLVVGQAGDLLVHRVRVLVPGPQALQVEYAETAEAAELDRDPGRDHPVHGRGEHGQAELVGVDFPGDVDVVRVAGAAARHDGDVV